MTDERYYYYLGRSFAITNPGADSALIEHTIRSVPSSLKEAFREGATTQWNDRDN